MRLRRIGEAIVRIDKVNALALHPFARSIRYLDLILVTRINATCQYLKYINRRVLLPHLIVIFFITQALKRPPFATKWTL